MFSPWRTGKGRASRLAWFLARLRFAANWAFNVFPRKYTSRWYDGEFVRRVGYFARANPWPLPHSLLSSVVIVHSTLFAAISMLDESAAAIFLLFALTTRLGGAVASTVGVSYTAASSWINIGYAVSQR